MNEVSSISIVSQHIGFKIILENCYLKAPYKIGCGKEWGLCLKNTEEVLKTGNFIENWRPKYLIRGVAAIAVLTDLCI